MQRFLTRLFIFLVLILIPVIAIEIYVQSIDVTPQEKQRIYLEKNADQIEGLIIGASHINRSLNPEYLSDNVANLSIRGSSINVDRLIFDYAMKSIHPKYVILNLSKGYIEKRNSETWISSSKAPYYFDLERTKQAKDFIAMRNPLLLQILQLRKSKNDINQWGFITKVNNNNNDFYKSDYDSTKIAQTYKTHQLRATVKLRAPYNYKKNREDLQHIIDVCDQRNMDLILINPPKYYLYNEAIDSNHTRILNDLVEELKQYKHVHYWDYSTSMEQDAHAYYNISHMAPAGAEKFTKIIDQRIQLEGIGQ